MRNDLKKGPTVRLLTIPEAANLLGLKCATLRTWIWTRQIEYVKLGRSVRLREDVLQDLIEQGTIPAGQTGPDEAQR